MKKTDIRKMAMIGMLCAVSFLMVLVGRLVPNVAGFLSYDPKDAMVAISGFVFGPVSAMIISVIVSFIESISISDTGPIGLFMNVISTCAFALPAALIYKKNRSMGGAIFGLTVGVIFMTCCMVFWNYLITPYYMKNVSRSAIAGMLLPVFIPFNLIKGGLNMGLTLLLYKPIITALRRVHVVPRSAHSGEKKMSVQIGVIALSVVVLATCFVLLLMLAEVI